MDRLRVLVWALPLGALLGATAPAQEQRSVQTGVKTSDSGYATALQVQVPAGEDEEGQRIVREGFELLRDATVAAGFTPVGKARIVVQVGMEGPPQGTLPFLLQLPIIEQPTAEDLKAEHDLQLLPLKADKVAYTYHKGPVAEVPRTFMRLAQWTIGQGLDMVGQPTMILYDISGKVPEVIEVQIPVK
jgi:hypothetical protein